MGWFVIRYGPHLIENVHQGVNIIYNMPCRLTRPHYVHHPQLMGACTWTTAQKCAMLSGAICLGCVCDFVGGARCQWAVQHFAGRDWEERRGLMWSRVTS